MNPKVKVTYKTGPNKGSYEGWSVKEERSDSLVLWKDGSINLVKKDKIKYDDHVINDLKVHLYKAQKKNAATIESLSTELKKAKDQIQHLTDSINANYSKMESYMKEERTFRSHVIDCFEELKNMKGFTSSPKKRKRDSSPLNTLSNGSPLNGSKDDLTL